MPNNIFDEMTNDASQEIATEISIENLSKLAAQIVELESVIATKETELNEEKAKGNVALDSKSISDALQSDSKL